MSFPSNQKSVGFQVHCQKSGFTFGLMTFLILIRLGALSAQPDQDRSLTVDQKGVSAGQPANTSPTNAMTPSTLLTSAQPGEKDKTADLTTLSREELQAKVKQLTENLTLANSESEFFRLQWQELRLRDQALGVEALTVNERKLEDKLVQAVKEVYQGELKRREGTQLLDRLLVLTEKLLKTAPNYDPAVRAQYEVVSRSSKDYLAGRTEAAVPIAPSLTDGRIADVNPSLNSVILNVGKSQGAVEGMPFLVYQKGVQVGTVKIVLARELVSAALVQDLRRDVVLKVGDRAAVAARK